MSTFTFKEFEIYQANSALKVGTDAMVLGAFVDVSNKKKCLDIGAGTGVLSLMVAQKNLFIQVKAIEIDPASTIDLLFNFKHSKWQNRLVGECQDFLTLDTSEKFDLIITNPPYYETKNLNSRQNIAQAKHEGSLPFNLLFQQVRELLMEEGTFWMILPAENALKWNRFAEKLGLFCKEEISIFGKPGNLKRKILAFSKIKQEKKEINLIIRDYSNQYTNEYKALTKKFHSKEL
ncbi:MAG: methyltransferase [Flavobacteriia bacterium]|nr:methyltransferase [Flavobacteriia bacterium]